MTRDEIVTALRCCANHTACNSCELRNTGECLRIMPAAADLIENQQREIEALKSALHEMAVDFVTMCRQNCT